MNYEKLLQGKTKDQIYEIADNWYQRLNKIKAAHARPSDDEYPMAIYQNIKAEQINEVLTGRIFALTSVISKMERFLQTPRYPSGGVDIIEESGPETILIKKTFNN